MEGKKHVVVLGAGVSGLTTAMLLSLDPSYSITVVAKHMPGDYDLHYASPWAGANYFPVGRAGTPLARFERNTWPALHNLALNTPAAGIHMQRIFMNYRDRDADTARGNDTSAEHRARPWFADVVPGFEVVSDADRPEGVDFAVSFMSVCINTAIYLPWLASQCLARGVVLRRGEVSSAQDAARRHHAGPRVARVVVNATGLGSLELGGVRDSTLYPARGQTVLVANSPGAMHFTSGTDDGPREETYIMERAGGGGTILGGTYEPHSWNGEVDMGIAERIMQRCASLCPALTGNAGSKGTTTRDVEAAKGLKVIRYNVGLRPCRKDGPRVERERADGLWVVHNYGHGGYGYQASFGCAYEAEELVKSCFEEKARL